MISGNEFEIVKYAFNSGLISEFQNNPHVSDLWPVVYILSDETEAYVGETADAKSRMLNHLNNEFKNHLTAIYLIGSKKFNKSATLDIESNFIKYLAADGKYELLNANIGLANHTYYQKKELYQDMFAGMWGVFHQAGLVSHTLKEIDNSDLFKYSPYKALTPEQRKSLLGMINGLITEGITSIVLEGGAGTGKTILAVFLFKLLYTDIKELNFKEFGEEEEELLQLVIQLKEIYDEPDVVLVIPMSSFRKTMQNVFQGIRGLNKEMVIGPAEVSNKQYDIIMVDESHRLRRRINLGSYFHRFDTVSEALQFDKDSDNELDWMLKQGRKQLFFYDENQSIKPSDVLKESFDQLKSAPGTEVQVLKSQFRVKGGNGYIDFISKLLSNGLTRNDAVFKPKNYDLRIVDSLDDMVALIKEKDDAFGLSRLVAGYAWEWKSKKDKSAYDIVIDGVQLRWNNKLLDWINSDNAVDEVGCIHTVQGYDLNYTGVIFGEEIAFDKEKQEIIIRKEKYHDRTGKNSIKDPEILKGHILRIYQTMLLRGIHGTYIYVCDPDLRAYFEKWIPAGRDLNRQKGRLLPVNTATIRVPFYDVRVAAGNFSDVQSASEISWIDIPEKYTPAADYFACRIIGNSMDKVVKNGSLCLFRKDPGGSREGKIVLAEHRNIQDVDFGGMYTLKRYHSTKVATEDNWTHTSVVLKPESTHPDYKEMVLEADDLTELKIIGIFVEVLTDSPVYS